LFRVSDFVFRIYPSEDFMPDSTPRLVVLTGVSRGLGLAMAEGLIERGHTVAGCARGKKHVEALGKRFGKPHRFDVVDVADDAQVGKWAKGVLKELGPPDLLLNNAALVNRNAQLWNVPADEFSQVIDVNIKGVFHVLRHYVPAMVERGSGVIVNFSSGWGRSTSPEVAPYCATKWAVEGLTRALAEELPSGMAAVPLNPGVIHTEMLESCFGAGAASYPSPQQWAQKAVPFLLQLGPRDNGEPLSVRG
jgi:NAD(P)-dependent dehydrogenase (short-subunit alcohol dehydrogenase family)